MAYEVWREKCVEKLNGMFAFAVWDEQKKELFLARDRMGQKPLYFAAPSGAVGGVVAALAFASELNAVRVIDWFDPELNLPGISEYLRWGYTEPSRTVYNWAYRFSPAGWWRFSRRDFLAGTRYFDANDVQSSCKHPSATTRELVAQAVTRQLVSDVPLGCVLSGRR
jgi:asparagine synthase (glutamine-hydrolysing)